MSSQYSEQALAGGHISPYEQGSPWTRRCGDVSHGDVRSETGSGGDTDKPGRRHGMGRNAVACVCWSNGGWRPEAGPLSLHCL